MRLIDADDLANKVADLYTEGDNATEADKVVNDVIDLIDNAPTVDTDIVPLMQDIVANIPEIVDKAVKLYIEERRRENEVN